MIGLQSLTLKEKIGQMLLIGISSKDVIDDIIDMIKFQTIGGVILYRNNYSDYQEMLDLIKRLKVANNNNKLPLFIAIDQEGGRVNRMPPEFKVIYNSYKLANSNDENVIRVAGNITAEILNKTGINMNFGPVMDLKKFSDNHAIGDRSFSSSPEIVSKYGIITMKEYQKKDIVSVIKHFPGHGAVKGDSHYFLPIILNYEQVLKEHIIPFKKAIDNDCDAIMLSHIIIHKKTNFKPATLSKKFINNEIRNKCNYNGVIITDDLRMHSVKLLFGKYKAIEKAFASGNDIITFKYLDNNDSQIIKKVIQCIEDNKIVEEDINKSVERIINLKQKYKCNDTDNFKGVSIDSINKRILVLNKNVN